MAKEFQKLTIKDPFMFAAVMNDEETCRRMLETILEMQILEVSFRYGYERASEQYGLR